MTEKKTRQSNRVLTRKKALTTDEEKVVRMRRGLTAPGDLKLEQIGQDNPEIAAQLRAIEERAIAMVGARQTPSKRKIINALRRRSNPRG